MHGTTHSIPDASRQARGPRDWLALAGFIGLVFVGGLLIGLATVPGPWYEGLEKPAFNPPNWIFGPVWSVLYLIIGFVGWRTWKNGSSGAQRLWWGQLALNFLWSPAFFAMHQVGLALVIVLAMLATILAFMTKAYRDGDRLSSLLFVPYAAWVSFASLLNASIFWLN